MPSSRSAKEICQQYGDDSMDCRVAKSVQRDRPATPAAPPAAAPPVIGAQNPATKRKKYLEDKLAEEGV